MITVLKRNGQTKCILDNSGQLIYQVEGTTPGVVKMADTKPQDESTKPAGKKRGPESFKGKSFALKYNTETAVYNVEFGGQIYPIRFENPAPSIGLIDPLAGGIMHRSGRHEFKLSFEGDILVNIRNLSADPDEGEGYPQVASVQVPFDSELAKWLRVVVELPVEKAFRLK